MKFRKSTLSSGYTGGGSVGEKKNMPLGFTGFVGEQTFEMLFTDKAPTILVNSLCEYVFCPGCCIGSSWKIRGHQMKGQPRGPPSQPISGTLP